MGCGSSRGVIVPSDQNIKKSSTNNLQNGSTKNLKNSRGSVQADKNNNVNQINPDGNAENVEENLEKRRDISASSTRTADSGISELQNENILTENSHPKKLIEVGASERPNTPDLILEGVACPRKQSGKAKRRLELQKKNSESSVPTLPPLTNNSLLERPATRGGVAFDITFCPETGNIKKAPPNLPKLERRKKKKKLTKDELEEKMRKATERRREHNQKIVEKSHAFIQQYENVVQRRNNTERMETSEGRDENCDNAKDNVTEVMKTTENEGNEIASQ